MKLVDCICKHCADNNGDSEICNNCFTAYDRKCYMSRFFWCSVCSDIITCIECNGKLNVKDKPLNDWRFFNAKCNGPKCTDEGLKDLNLEMCNKCVEECRQEGKDVGKYCLEMQQYQGFGCYKHAKLTTRLVENVIKEAKETQNAPRSVESMIRECYPDSDDWPSA